MLDVNFPWTAQGHLGTTERETTPDLFSTNRSSQHVGDLTTGQNDMMAIFVFLLMSMQSDARTYATTTTTTEGVF